MSEGAVRHYYRDADWPAGRPGMALVPPTDSASAARPKVIAAIEPAQRGRIASVDALRGFNIFWLLGADAAAYALQDVTRDAGPAISAAGRFISDQFTHAAWEGMRFYDFIFPLLIFVTGLSIVFSLSKLVAREGKAAVYRRVLRRSLLLWALGVLYYGGLSNMWPDIRLVGVLQRIAICYLFASLLFINLGVRGLIATCATLLVGYWAIMTFVPVPGFGVASYADHSNLAIWIDQNFLPGRRWYGGVWDPEGLITTLPAIATCLIGVLAGLVLQDPRLSPQFKAVRLIAGGAVMALAGHLWGLQFPVIKNLWTSSYVLVTGGYSAILLGVFYQVIDVWGWRSWSTVFVWIGANALMLYFLNAIMPFSSVATRLVGGDIASFLERHVASGTGQFVASATGVVLAVLLARYLYQRKVFVRV